MSDGMARAVHHSLLFLAIHLIALTTGQDSLCSSSPITLKASTQLSEISSPGYPNGYINNLNCGWRIEADNGYVKVNVGDYNMEDSEACVFDALEIYDGSGSEAIAMDYLCGISDCKSRQVYYSSGHSLEIWFRSDQTEARKGFRLTYQWISNLPNGQVRPCSQGQPLNLQASTEAQTLTSFNFPNKYPNRMDCYWNITTSSDDTFLEIVVAYTFLEASDNCAKDWLKVYKGSIQNDNLVVNLCGTLQDKHRMFVPAGGFVIHFHSDQQTSAKGFRLSYKQVDEEPDYSVIYSDECPEAFINLTATNEPQSLTSPNYPGNSPTELLCDYDIRALSPSKHVKVNVVDYGIEDSPECDTDVLLFYSLSNDEHVYLCGEIDTKISHVYWSAADLISFSFWADQETSGRGFSLTYQQVDETPSPTAADACPGEVQRLEVTSDLKELRPYTFQGYYLDNLDCRWNLTSTYGFVKILVKETYIEDFDCARDYVDIFDGHEAEENRIARLCGQSISPNTYWTTSTHATIHFHTDYTNVDKGFQILFSQVNERFTDITAKMENTSSPVLGS